MIPVRSSPSFIEGNNSSGHSTSHLLPLSISLAVSSSSLASNTYNGEETDEFIPPGRSSGNSCEIPKYPSSLGDGSSSSGRSSQNNGDSPVSPGQGNGQIETDPIVLARRQKQIDYGKNTQEYANYLKAVPVNERAPCHPRTPPMRRKYSRRAWDGLIKRWRLNLHCWTYPEVRDVEFDDNGNYFYGLNDIVARKRHDESFGSETTAATSRSTSTTSSNLASFPSFQDYGYRDREYSSSGRLLPVRNHLNVEHGEFKLFSPPGTRPSSSLCFAEFRDESQRNRGINRQSTSEQDLITCSSAGTPYNQTLGQFNFTWRINSDINQTIHSHGHGVGSRNLESANDFFKYFLKH